MNPLENLQDIHSPAEIGLWPLAYGWWILALVTIIFIGLTAKWLISFYQIRKNRKFAIQELKDITDEQNKGAIQINQLLKRVAIVYFPNVSIQKLHGEQWAEFLLSAVSNKQAEALTTQIQNLQSSLYRKPTDKQQDLGQHKQLAATWIKQALPPNKKTVRKLEQNYA